MSKTLKLEISVADLGQNGVVVSEFATTDYVANELSKKANLNAEGKVDPSLLPDYTYLDGLVDKLDDVEQSFLNSDAEILNAAKLYSDNKITQNNSKKADLVEGKVPFEQLPFSMNFEQNVSTEFGNVRQELRQNSESIVSQMDGLVGSANSYTDGKVLEEREFLNNTINEYKGEVNSQLNNFGKEVGDILKSGAYLPYDPDMEYVEGALTLKDGEIQQFVEGVWVPFKTNALNVVDASGESQQQVNYSGGSKWHSRVGGYQKNERAVLDNGDIVKSTINGNTNDPNVSMTGWVKPEKIFNIEYFGGVADYDETTKTILTDSGDALREAIVEAKKVMGCVYIPSSPKGKAFYASGNFNLSVDGFTEGVRVIGDGKIASKLYASPIDVTKPIFGGETGAPGNPTNISISGMSLISHEKWVGTCLQFNGACITEIPDLYIKDFDCNIEFVNDTLAPNGIFTEFVRVSNSHLRNGKTNLRFRKRNNGDASFHGVNFSGLSMDGTDEAGQIGIDIGEGCYVYGASWSQVNIFSTGEGIALKNAGNRNGFDELYFEGNGRVENTSTGTWDTDGRWFVQNDTGLFDDRSVGNTQFITGNYQTSKNNTSADFTNLGLSKFRAGTGDTARKKLTRVFGNGIEGFSLNFFTGNGNSWSGTQGLALTYSTNNDQNSKPDGIACYLTLNRFSSFLSEYNFSYKQDTPQLTINSSGRHSGRMGRYKSAVVPVSASGQTVIVTGVIPTTQQSVLVSIDCSANNISYSALYLCSKWNGANTNGILIGITRFENMPSGISQVYTNDSGLNIVFDSAVSVALNMNISVVGVGIY